MGAREKFDPNRHCGSLTKKGRQCIMQAGEKTDHTGIGSCWLHEPKKPAKYVKLSDKYLPLSAQVNRIATSEELLSLDREIALSKALIERISSQLEQFDDAGFGAVPSKLWTTLNETLKTLNSLAGTAYNMRFSKRFSIPITEMAMIVQQIAQIFNETAIKYELPPEAREEFAARIRKIRTLKLAPDKQLSRAGEESEFRGQVIEVSENLDDEKKGTERLSIGPPNKEETVGD